MPGGGAKPGERRGGRQKGTPNKINADLREMILGALDDAGGRGYLAEQARTSPGAFLTLVGKVLPTQLTGAGGGAVQVLVDTGVQRTDDEPDDPQDEPGL